MRKLLYSLAMLALIVACQPKPTPVTELSPQEQDFFADYINTHTSGAISRTSPISFAMARPVDKYKEGDEIDQSILTIRPKVKGSLIWDGWRSFKFVPEGQLPMSTEYSGTIDLSKLYDNLPSGKDQFSFVFQTHKPRISAYRPSLIPLDANDLTKQKIEGRFKLNDFLDLEEIKKCFTALQDSKPLAIDFSPSEEPKTYAYSILGVSRGEAGSNVIVTIDGKPIKSESKFNFNIQVPALNNFEVTDIQARQSPEQHIEIQFSDFLDANQDLTGLIRLSNGSAFRTTKSQNTITLYPTRRISESFNVIVDQTIKNNAGYQLKSEKSQNLAFSTLRPQIQKLSSGVIMPTSDEGIIYPFRAVSLHSVRVKVIQIFEDNIGQFFQVNEIDQSRELKRVGRLIHKSIVKIGDKEDDSLLAWNDYAIDLSDMVHAEPGAIYRIVIESDASMSVHPDDTKFQKTASDDLVVVDPEMESYDEVRSYWDYYGDDYYDNGRSNSIVSNVIASNLGIIAKRTKNGRLRAIVTNLITTDPLSGVEVIAYNVQGQVIASNNTNSQGFVDLSVDSKPFFIEAKQNGQVGYLKTDDGHALSMSMFDVSGGKQQRGLKGMIYQERGVSRPGDSLYLTFILDDRDNPLPSLHPVILELYDPKNQLSERKVMRQSVNNFYTFRTKTSVEAPTGNWLTKVKVGGAEFSKTVKIETIKPNRLKIDLDFPGEVLSTNNIPSGSMNVQWLHGAVGKNLKTDIELTLKSGNTKFDRYKEYQFDDLSKSFEPSTEMIFDDKVDENGNAVVSPDLKIGNEAPGMVNAYFKVRAYEDGGNFSIMQFNEKVSPFQSYVGVRVPEGTGWRGALASNEDSPIQIVTVDEEGNPINRNNLQIEIYALRWSWWWERSNRNNIRNYISDRNANLLQSRTISTSGGKATFNFNLGTRNWGRKLILIKDPVSGHTSSQVFYTDYSGWWDSGDTDFQGAAEMLTFKTNKDDYSVGEMIDLVIPKSKSGRALVSIENGSDILEEFWVEVDDSNGGQVSIPASPDMAPNAYIHVTLIQPHAQKTNDRPIRLYGVQGINVVNPVSKLNPIIDMAAEIRPETDYEVTVTESNGQAMTYTLAVVDDGILDLTRYKTPQPWNAMYAKEALGVLTWDLYSDVMGAYGGALTQLLALGGDEFESGNSNKKANRFKPIVSFIGPFELRANQKKTHKLSMPNYVGSVRTMVVAGDPRSGAYGHSEKTTPVKKPLMVLSTIPRVLSPNETLDVPISVFAMDPKVKNVKVTVESNDLLQFEKASQNIKFNTIGDQIVKFPIKVNDKIGIAKYKVTVAGAGETATEEIELDVRIPNPAITQVKDEILEIGETNTMSFDYFGVKGTNEGILELSTMPPLNLEKRLSYLIRYPHGCVEQTTSAAFPQVHLPDLATMSNDQRQEIQDNVMAALNKLKSYQRVSGGFGYWPSSSDSNDWSTSYVGHFMLSAESKGYTLPFGMKDNWLKFQKSKANNWSPNAKGYWRANSWELSQAYRLYTLALAGEPALGAMNRLRGRRDLPYMAKWKLAGAYAQAGKSEVAKEIIAGLTYDNMIPYEYHSYTYGSNTRDLAMILETKTELGLRTEALAVVKILADRLASKRWYSTHTSAYTLAAIARFIGKDGMDHSLVTADLKIEGQPTIAVEMNKPIQLIDLPIDEDLKGKLTLKHRTGSELFVRLAMTGTPMAGIEESTRKNLKMSVVYSYTDGSPVDMNRIPQGSDIISTVTVTNPGSYYTNYRDLALTQVFPAGWEISNARLDESTSGTISNTYDYQDVRDDRVMTYFHLSKSQKLEVKLKLNATYSGSYYLPGTYVEAMYDNAINAADKGQWVNIVEQ